MGGQPSKERVRRLAVAKQENEIFGTTQSSLWSSHSLKDSLSREHFGPTGLFVDQFLLALYDYTPPSGLESQSQISVEKDDRLRLFGYSADGDWADVECLRTCERGWVPTNYTTPLTPPGRSNLTNRPSSVTFQQSNSRGTSGHGSQASLAGVGLDMEKWYHGAIQRSYAEYLLNSGITGSFLVRESESKPGQLTISLRYEGRIYHYRINRDDNGMFYVTDATKFLSVSDLIHHHGKQADGLACTLLYPAAKRDKVTSEVSPEVDVWEIDRTEIIMKHKLGSGQYGIVYEALWKPYNILVAVKTLKEDVTVRDEFLEEARVMKSLRHPNLVELLGACTQEPPYYIVTEFMCNGNLLDYLRCRSRDELTPPVLLHMATQVARGMAYLEQHNFIHRDLAARNCLVGKQQTIKVADFGLARCMERDLTYQAHEGAKFPIKWTAPEGLVYNLFSTKSDVWAFGVLLWEIATYGKTPYPGVELQDVYVLLEKGTRMNQPEGCPEPIYKLMLQCWQWLPEQRPTFSVLLGQLEAMHKSATIEEQVAIELARTTQPTPQQPVLKPSSFSSNQSCTTPDRNKSVNVGQPHPPLPPRPPPPRRSTSFDRLLEERRSANGRGSPASDEGQLDSGVGEPTPWTPTRNLRGDNPKIQSTLPVQPVASEAPPERFPLTGSLGRKRTAPRPPRRTTPVKPIVFDSDQIVGDYLVQDELPPCPVSGLSAENIADIFPPPPAEFEPSGSQCHGRKNLNKSVTVSQLPLSQLESSIPPLMTSSAIYPGAVLDSSSTKPARPSCLSYLSCITKTRLVSQPSSWSSKATGQKTCVSDSSGLHDKTKSPTQPRHFSESNAGRPILKTEINSSRLFPSATNSSSVDTKQSPLRRPTVIPVPSADFHDELRQRLQLQSQNQDDATEEMRKSNRARPQKSPTKPALNVSNGKLSEPALEASVTTASGFFTLPRLRTAHTHRSTTGQDQQAVSETATDSSSSKILPSQTSPEVVCSSRVPAVVEQTSLISPTPPVPTLRNHKVSVSWVASKSNKKRLSWTGPAVHQSGDSSLSTQRAQRFCLPTILSTSSTALDTVEVNTLSSTPTRKSILTQLLDISNTLARLKSSVPNPNGFASEVEQIIAVADQLEACRVNCSEFIDQATCPARAKFSFRDRYAPLQQMSDLLRSKKTDTERSSMLQSAVSAVDDLITELMKIPETIDNEEFGCQTTTNPSVRDAKKTDNMPVVMTSV
ncbi:hypothetical protein CRM22_001124 [Opisthorchis felineus]|uniref:Tyrosine-protein kinase n=1 Tax=Opisthorchis felineus TaxID=147828 RepID=A0A4S2MC23_OPIFE|nr:hypothetical protein CRM22_001124 [Opisthorchis felineus]